jgi:hypothetical protein
MLLTLFGLDGKFNALQYELRLVSVARMLREPHRALVTRSPIPDPIAVDRTSASLSHTNRSRRFTRTPNGSIIAVSHS